MPARRPSGCHLPVLSGEKWADPVRAQGEETGGWAESAQGVSSRSAGSLAVATQCRPVYDQDPVAFQMPLDKCPELTNRIRLEAAGKTRNRLTYLNAGLGGREERNQRTNVLTGTAQGYRQ